MLKTVLILLIIALVGFLAGFGWPNSLPVYGEGTTMRYRIEIREVGTDGWIEVFTTYNIHQARDVRASVSREAGVLDTRIECEKVS